MEFTEQENINRARAALAEILKKVPGLTVKWGTTNIADHDIAKLADFTLQINFSTYVHGVAVEYKEHGFPQQLRQAIDRLIRYRYKSKRHDELMVCAPFISEEGAELCRNDEVSYFDLAGNCRISMGPLYIERTGFKNPFQKNVMAAPSLYGMRGERILRVLLTDPKKAWRVAPLAEFTGVSVGTVSIIRKLLMDRDWAKDMADGIVLTQPERLLQDWAQVWGRRAYRPFAYFSRLPVDETERRLAEFARTAQRNFALTGVAGAWRVAPMTRYQRTQVYWDGEPDELAATMDLKKTDSGANVHILKPRDRGVFDYKEEIGGIPVVCPIQLYLDLQRDPARGKEAAEHLWQVRLFHA